MGRGEGARARRARRAGAAAGRPGPAEEALAAHLTGLAGGEEVAWVAAEDATWWAAAGAGRSALVELLLGVLAGPDAWRAQRALRNRLWATSLPGPFELGAVQVLGRRLGEPVRPGAGAAAAPVPLARVAAPPLPAPPPLEEAFLAAAAGASRASARLRLALALEEGPDLARPRWARDRPVAALLFGPAGELLGWARNRVGLHRAWHAELLLLLGWAAAHAGARLPAGCELVVGLEPCAMCAGLLWSLAAEPATLRVRFARPDPGPAARGSILRPDSAARRRFARDSAELGATPSLQVDPG